MACQGDTGVSWQRKAHAFPGAAKLLLFAKSPQSPFQKSELTSPSLSSIALGPFLSDEEPVPLAQRSWGALAEEPLCNVLCPGECAGQEKTRRKDFGLLMTHLGSRVVLVLPLVSRRRESCEVGGRAVLLKKSSLHGNSELYNAVKTVLGYY